MCNATHHKLFGLGLTDVNEVCKRIVFIMMVIRWLVDLWCSHQIQKNFLEMFIPVAGTHFTKLYSYTKPPALGFANQASLKHDGKICCRPLTTRTTKTDGGGIKTTMRGGRGGM